MPQASAHRRAAVILTALDVETQAVLRHLTNWSERTIDGTVFYLGRFEDWDIAVAEAGAGNTSAAAIAERAIANFRPIVALFVGIAGGIKDANIGDVVVADKIYGYEAGKDAETGFRPRPEVKNSAHDIEQRGRAMPKSSHWLTRLDGTLKHNSPKVFVGPIAAGEKVVASTRSATAAFLRKYYSDALAIEMEGRGFLEGVSINALVLGGVVRGISDLLSGKAEADKRGSQQLAADAASAAAFEILHSLPRPKRNRESTTTKSLNIYRSFHFVAKQDPGGDRVRKLISDLDRSATWLKAAGETGDALSRQLLRYLQGAMQLRRAIAWKEFDDNPGCRIPARTILLVGTDIINMFMAPAKALRDVNPFTGNDSDVHSFASSVATAEFIFFGNPNGPAYICPSDAHHFEESLSRARTWLQYSFNAELFNHVGEAALIPILRTLETREQSIEQRLQLLLDAIPSALADLLTGPVQEMERWLRLFRSGRILPLTALPRVSHDIFQPDQRLVAEWSNRIQSALKLYPEWSHRPYQRQGQAFRSAISLATAISLNETGLRKGSSSGWRVVLITRSGPVHRAYSDWAKAQGDDFAPERFVLRHPLQFSPIVNIERPDKDIFDNLKTSLDCLLGITLNTLPNKKHSLYYVDGLSESRIRDIINVLPLAALKDDLARSVDCWLGAMRHANALNHSYLVKDFEQILAGLEQIFRNKDIHGALEDRFRAILADLNESHRRWFSERTTGESGT